MKYYILLLITLFFSGCKKSHTTKKESLDRGIVREIQQKHEKLLQLPAYQLLYRKNATSQKEVTHALATIDQALAALEKETARYNAYALPQRMQRRHNSIRNTVCNRINAARAHPHHFVRP